MSDQQTVQSKNSWLMLVMVFLLSISIAIIWFSVPPLLSGGTLLNNFFPDAKPGPQMGAAMSKLGGFMSLVPMGALIAAIIASFLTKAIGVKNSFIIGGSLVTIAGLGCVLSGDNINLALAMRFIMGLGLGLSAVNSPTAISMWFDQKKRATAMAIWATWVPVGSIVGTNLIVNPMAGKDLAHASPHTIWAVMTVICFIALLGIILIYKNPKKGETEISTEAKPFKEVLPIFKQHQFVMVGIAWLAYNYVNYCFTTYNTVFFAGGFSDLFDGPTANMWGSIASALGIIAPIFGVIYDKIQRNRKYLLIMLGVAILCLAATTGFKTEFLGLSGWPLFIMYLVFQCLSNAILVASIRPYVPLLVGRGGVTAVSLGLSVITILQYAGQMVSTSVFGGLVSAGGGVLARNAGQPIGELSAWVHASWVTLVVPSIVALVCCFFIKPAPLPPGAQGGPQHGGH
jgi:MFS family permease